jgi:hypothetical protein
LELDDETSIWLGTVEWRAGAYMQCGRRQSGGREHLATILMDDGGVSLLRSLEHVRKGLNAVNAVIAGEVGSATWERETWGARIANGAALLAWLEFTGKTADSEAIRHVEI